MSYTGIARQIDRNGRIVIPKELRDRYKLEIESFVEFFVEDDRIIIKKQDNPCCIFCGSNKDITIFRDRSICAKCISDLTDN